MEYFTVHGRGDAQGSPVRHGDELTGFIVDCYAVGDAPKNNHLLYDSAFLSRAKGCDKSGRGARLGLFEALGPCRWAGWARGGEVYRDPWGLGFEYVYMAGEPLGKPVRDPLVRLLATEEGQTGNVYDSIYYNLTEADAPLSRVPGVDAGLTRTFLPSGEIRPSTASSAAKDGGLETFAVFDETHLYVLPELRHMYNTVTRNMRKRKRTAGTWYLETTTMFAPGQGSVAESTYELAEAILEQRTRRSRLLYDHRWGECADLTAEESLRAAILEAFGEAIDWNGVEEILDEFYDPRKDPADSRRYFLNARTTASDAWLDAAQWRLCGDATIVVADGERITLGFDGSVREDATALVGCRVSDGHLFLLGCWEKPLDAGVHWQVDRVAVDAAVAAAMGRYDVVGMYADPAHWQDYIDKWSEEFGPRMRVRASKVRPLEWWTNRPTATVAALERLHDAVAERRVTHDGSTVLTRHVLNAHRRASRVGIQIGKEHPNSTRKIDAAMAATLAYECRADAVAQGFAKPRKRRRAVGF